MGLLGSIRRGISYNDKTAEYEGPGAPPLLNRNYEKSLTLLWRAQDIAPWLGIRDHADRQCGIGPIDTARLEAIRKEFDSTCSPERRNAIARIMSLIMHGEAYALYTSSTLLPRLRSTEAKLGMAMQVMEEAKHFYTLRQLLRHLDLVRPLSGSARLLFDTIAVQPTYFRLFGMNTVLESAATNIFAEFSEYPGLRDVLHQFHLDESRHVAFPQTYRQNGLLPRWYSDSKIAQWWRAIMLGPVAGVFFEYKDDFETLGIDPYEFFGRLVNKITLSAERSGMPLPWPRRFILKNVNFQFNLMSRYLDGKKSSKRDFTLMRSGIMNTEIMDREREVYGDELFGSGRKTDERNNPRRPEVARQEESVNRNPR